MATVSNNLGWAFLSYLIRIYTGSFFFIIIAKYISINDFGLLTFGYSFAAIVQVLAEFGYSLMSMKDIPQKTFEFNDYIYNSLIQKIVISLIVTFISFIYISSIYSYTDTFSIAILFIVYAVVMSFNVYFLSVFKAISKFNIETVFNTINAICLTLLIILHILFDMKIITIAYVIVAIRFIQFVWVTFEIFKIIPLNSVSFNSKIQKYLITNSWTYGLHHIIGIFYFTIDTQLIRYFLDNESVAFYQAIFRIGILLITFNTILTQVFLPFLSQKIKFDLNTFKKTSTLILEIIVIYSCSAILFFLAFQNAIIEWLYTFEYLSAATIVLPLSIIILLRSLALMYGNILTVADHQRSRVISVAISLLISAISNFYLIPILGILGAAWASVLTHAVLIFAYIYFVENIFKSIFLSNGTIHLLVIFVILVFLLVQVEIQGYKVLMPLIIWLGIVFVKLKKLDFLFIMKTMKGKLTN